MRVKDEIFCFAHLRWFHNGWASNISIMVEAGIHHSKYWMPIHYGTIKDGQTNNLIFYSLSTKANWIYERRNSFTTQSVTIKTHSLSKGHENLTWGSFAVRTNPSYWNKMTTSIVWRCQAMNCIHFLINLYKKTMSAIIYSFMRFRHCRSSLVAHGKVTPLDPEWRQVSHIRHVHTASKLNSSEIRILMMNSGIFIVWTVLGF